MVRHIPTEGAPDGSCRSWSQGMNQTSSHFPLVGQMGHTKDTKHALRNRMNFNILQPMIRIKTHWASLDHKSIQQLHSTPWNANGSFLKSSIHLCVRNCLAQTIPKLPEWLRLLIFSPKKRGLPSLSLSKGGQLSSCCSSVKWWRWRWWRWWPLSNSSELPSQSPRTIPSRFWIPRREYLQWRPHLKLDLPFSIEMTEKRRIQLSPEG